MDFDDFERKTHNTDTISGNISGLEKLEYCIHGATNQLGDIAGYIKKYKRDGDDYLDYRQDVAVRLGNVMWYIAIATRAMGFTLDSIANQNIQRNEHRWLSERGVSGDLFSKDEDFCSSYPEEEQLPLYLWAEFVSSVEDGLPKVEVFVQLDNSPTRYQFGDKVDDNANSADGYRFHDIFHFGYCAFLDWSPVVRGLLNRKRKSNVDVDRVQDGARAQDREEATTNFIYEYVVRHNFLQNTNSVDTSLLDLIQSMTSDLEVSVRRKRQWENLIVECARIQTKLMENDGGWVKIDRYQRIISYSKSGPK